MLSSNKKSIFRSWNASVSAKLKERRTGKKKNLIIKYFPSFDANLLQPGYTGIRPIMNKEDKSMRDFVIQTEDNHTIPNLINLYGIESPGLTSSLSIAKYIKDFLI